jgi:hypothetical protein
MVRKPFVGGSLLETDARIYSDTATGFGHVW